MRAIYMLVIMLFLHSYADYHLQGILASMKQKGWWESQIPNLSSTRYIADYKAALIAHSFEWAFAVTLPALYQIVNANTGLTWPDIRTGSIYICLLVAGTFLHGIVDNMKANDHSINLISDQVFHIVQVVVTWLLWLLIVGW